MLFEFRPWKLDIDVEATSKQYSNSERNRNINLTNQVISLLSENQENFFIALGVDITKVDITEYIYEFPETEPPSTIISMKINFLMCGRFCEIPEFQNKLYWKGNEKIFTDQYPRDLAVASISSDEYFTTYDINNMAVVFKHPYMSIQDEKFIKWDCGYILGNAIIKIER